MDECKPLRTADLVRGMFGEILLHEALAGGSFTFRTNHSTDLEPPPSPLSPPRVSPCVSIHPEGKSCGHVQSRFWWLFRTALVVGRRAGRQHLHPVGHGRRDGHVPQGKAVQVDPIKPTLKAPGIKLLNRNMTNRFQILLSNSTCAATARS